MARREAIYLGDDTCAILRNYTATFSLQGDSVPSRPGAARILGISVSRLEEWANDPEKTDFREAVRELETEQERTLINKGLNGLFNATISKLALGRHGYTEKQEHQVQATTMSASVSIPVDMDPKEASRIYQEMLNGV